MTRSPRFLLLAAMLLHGTLAPAAAVAAPPVRVWQSVTFADRLKGDTDHLSVDDRGRLTLGPDVARVDDVPSPFLWTLLPQRDGSVLAGAGNDGRVYRLDAQGRRQIAFDAEELEIHALAARPDGGFYAASSPDGRIYAISPSGTATPFYDPPDRYIWALAVARDGTVYAGAGDGGTVYRITPRGEGSVFYRTRATHATALAFDAHGDLLVGTAAPGRVFRVSPSGQGFLLLDTTYPEVRAVRPQPDGRLVVLATAGTPPAASAPAAVAVDATASPSPSGAPVASVSVSTEVTAVVVDTATPANTAPARVAVGGSKGAVFQMTAAGAWERWWDARDDAPYDMDVDADGTVTVVTGPAGRVYRLAGAPARAALLHRAAAQQVTAIARDSAGHLLLATANPGRVLRVGTTPSATGRYESDVRDAAHTASWGAVTWRAIGSVRLETRSGNTEVPDDDWSPWTAVPSSRAVATSPAARYLQWRALLSRTEGQPSPELQSVTLAYKPHNVRPTVTSVTVLPQGTVFQKPYSSTDPDLSGFEGQSTPARRLAQAVQSSGSGAGTGRRTYEAGLRTIQWRADDENDDTLTYRVSYRREDASAWTLLRSDLDEPILVWDTTTVPSGSYVVRVAATDAAGRPGTEALVGEADSLPFDVDTTPPTVEVVVGPTDGAGVHVRCTVTDDYSAVERAEASTDGAHWAVLDASDGMPDTPRETFDLVLPVATTTRSVACRATDALQNTRSAQVTVPGRP